MTQLPNEVAQTRIAGLLEQVSSLLVEVAGEFREKAAYEERVRIRINEFHDEFFSLSPCQDPQQSQETGQPRQSPVG